MNTLLQDLRYGLRSLRIRPGFALVAIVTLALGIGLNAAVFTVVDAALLRNVPYAEADRLVHLWQVQDNAERRRFPFAWQTLRELQASDLFASVAGYSTAPIAWTGRPEPEELPALLVSANFFEVLGVRPALGRAFLPGEDELGGPRAVVLSDAFWRTRLGADREIVGRTLSLGGEPTTVVGVLPPGFPFAPGLDARVVIAAQPRGDRATRRILNWIRPIARLRDGVTVAQARKHLASFEDALRERFPDALGGVVTDVVPLRDELVGRVEPVLVLLFVCVSLVLLVACVNVANLLLARAAGRQKEISVRVALGAGRGRLVRQLLTESALLAAAGGALGLLAARLSLPLLLAGIPTRTRAGMPFLEGLEVDGRVLGYGAAVVILTTLLFGLLPALRASRPEVQGMLKDAAPPPSGPLRYGVRDLLVTVEIALAVMLLGSAGLMGKSLLRVLSADPGYRPEGALGLEVSLAEAGAQPPGAIIALKAKVQEAVEGIPGVSLAARVNWMPGTGSGGSHSFVRPDRPPPAGPEPEGYYREVSPGYFRTLGIPLLGGRDFGPEDSRASAAVVIVNRALQQRYFPGEDAIGKTIRPISSTTGAALTIVGVVGDQTLGGLDEARPAVLYYPDTHAVSPRWAVVVRSDRPGIAEELRRTLRDAAPGLVVGPARQLGAVLQQAPTMFLRRYPVFLLGVFAAVALVLACVGIFGVASFAVAGRTREFGIRMAVGAVRRDIVGLVLRGSSAPIVAGALGGLAGSVALATVFRGLLFGVASADPGVLAAVAGVLGAVAVVSALLPALRASRVDPAVALRSL
ncbi:MAG TPA: ABC transporter permease [Myxococcaceae bacterium]|nr:ABC transporter permease [Myxococcaceae bacterium]